MEGYSSHFADSSFHYQIRKAQPIVWQTISTHLLTFRLKGCSAFTGSENSLYALPVALSSLKHPWADMLHWNIKNVQYCSNHHTTVLKFFTFERCQIQYVISISTHTRAHLLWEDMQDGKKLWQSSCWLRGGKYPQVVRLWHCRSSATAEPPSRARLRTGQTCVVSNGPPKPSVAFEGC